MQSLAARITGVDEHVAGGAVVSEEELQRKLGSAAWHVWQVLCHRRERNGETHVSNRGILHAKGFAQDVSSERVLKRACAKLAQAKLVIPQGWLIRQVPKGPYTITRPVYVRTVYGVRLLKTTATAPSECAVPVATRLWLAAASSWGGRREASGRKPAPPSEEPTGHRDQSSGHPPAGHTKESRWYHDLMPKKESSGPHDLGSEKNQVVPPKRIENKHKRNTAHGFSLPSGSETRAAAAPVLSDSISETGLVVGGGARMVPPIGFPLQGVPRYPGQSVITPATVPDPPLLPEDGDDAQLVTLLARSYRSVVEHRYGGRCYALAKGDIRQAKNFKALVAFARGLIEHSIPPATWCIHRVDKWLRNPASKEGSERKPKQPTMNYVFALSALDTEKRWQFRAEYGDGKIGGRQIFSKKHIALLHRHKEMHSAIVRGASKAEAVEKFFPGELYQELVDDARRESSEIKWRLDDQVKRGVFVW